MISKETFCKTLQLIREQETVNREVSNVLNLVGNGHFVFGGGQQYYEALMMLLKEAACDQYDYISWWLYEGAPDYRIWTQDEKKEWCLKEPSDLYDFIRDGGVAGRGLRRQKTGGNTGTNRSIIEFEKAGNNKCLRKSCTR